MTDVSHIFKAYDIRGKVGDELNDELARNVARAFADWLPEDGAVAVGYDMRPDSKDLATAAIDGLKLQGREVIEIGQVASDMIYFAVGSLNLAGGLMVTASHNPGEYNGIKLCREGAGGVALDSGLSDIRDKALSCDFQERQQGSVVQKDIMDAWVDHAIEFAGEGLEPLKIAVDAGNGMAGAVVPHLNGKVPFEITPLFFELDGTFPNHQANPLKFETLRDLQKTITDNNLDGGVAFDGDGDRAVLVDELGEPLTGSVTTALLAEHFLAAKPSGTVLYNAICSRIVPETIERLGGKAIRTKVGHSLIKQKMKQHVAIFAGEHSAHYYFADNYRADSGLIAALAVLGLLSRSGKKLSELAAPYRKYVNSPEINFEVADKEAMIERIKQEYSDGEIDELDGLTVNYDDWWFNIRASNTEPLLRLNVEASTELSLKDHVAHLKGVLSKKHD